uniref:Extended synaptotagmin 1 n=1 Tax=Taeniopygia guttata TaxID=59729 RepID=A0A674GAK6_TAEGU
MAQQGEGPGAPGGSGDVRGSGAPGLRRGPGGSGGVWGCPSVRPPPLPRSSLPPPSLPPVSHPCPCVHVSIPCPSRVRVSITMSVCPARIPPVSVCPSRVPPVSIPCPTRVHPVSIPCPCVHHHVRVSLPCPTRVPPVSVCPSTSHPCPSVSHPCPVPPVSVCPSRVRVPPVSIHVPPVSCPTRVGVPQALAQAWPFVGQFVGKVLQDRVAPAVRGSSAHLQSFAFTRVDLGQKPLRILGVRAHPGTHNKQILLDLNISYVGDVQIDVEVKKFFCKAGVKGVQLHGVLRIILEPLLGEAPIVGALSVFFIRRPTLDINWTGLTNLLDIPGLSSLSDSLIMESIASCLVLPNRLLLPLLPDLPGAARLRWPLPRGVVRVALVAARALPSKDRFLGGLVAGHSDPYGVLRVGTQTATSRVIGDCGDPRWDEVYEFMVHEVPGQELEWFPLQEGGQGRLHLRLEWLSLLPDASKLDQVLEMNRKIAANPDPPSSAILVVYLDRAEGLPVRKTGKEPNPVVQVSVQDVTRESKVVCNTSAPVWEDAFRFFLHDPRNQEVDFQVKDDPRQTPLGSLSLPLSRLLSAPGMALDGPFPLRGAGPGARLHLQLELRVRRGRGEGVLGGLGDPQPIPPTIVPHFPPIAPHCPPIVPPLPPNLPTNFPPIRVLRVRLLAAEALAAKDRRLAGLVRGRSDPYAAVRAGGRRFRSRTRYRELNPRWDECYEVIVDDVPGQDVEFEIFDEDIDKDDFLGRCKVPLSRVLSSRVVDEWLPLQDAPSGRLHVRLESLEPRDSAAMLQRVLHSNRLQQPEHGPRLSAALLRVFLARAAELPFSGGPPPPRPFLGGVSPPPLPPQTCAPSPEPVWDEGFSFLILNPHEETLELQVGGGAGPALGALLLPLAPLLARAGLGSDGWEPLSGGGRLLLRAQLGVRWGTPKPAGGPQNTRGDPKTRGETPPPEPTAGPRLRLSLWHHREQRKLVAIVHGCRELRAPPKELPDPYVSLLLLPERSKRRTGVQKRTLNPDFDERFEWELPTEEAAQRRLEVTVKSTLSFVTREKEALGKLQLDLARVDLSEGEPRW